MRLLKRLSSPPKTDISWVKNYKIKRNFLNQRRLLEYSVKFLQFKMFTFNLWARYTIVESTIIKKLNEICDYNGA